MQITVQRFSRWLSKNRDENPRMRTLLMDILNWKLCACADSRRNFWTTVTRKPLYIFAILMILLSMLRAIFHMHNDIDVGKERSQICHLSCVVGVSGQLCPILSSGKSLQDTREWLDSLATPAPMAGLAQDHARLSRKRALGVAASGWCTNQRHHYQQAPNQVHNRMPPLPFPLHLELLPAALYCSCMCH